MACGVARSVPKKQAKAATVAVGALLFAIPGLLLVGNVVMQHFTTTSVSDRTLAVGIIGIVLIGIGVGVHKVLIRSAHKTVPTLKEHPIALRAQASGWKATLTGPGITKW